MKKLALNALALMFCFSAFAENPTPPKKKIKYPLPPNTEKISNNFFADKSEIKNLDYLEYMFWTKRVYGQTSEQYLAALPDTMVWIQEFAYCEPFIESYLRHPAYADYPVVGISYEQAVDYAAWRSDRILESRLIQAKKITADAVLKSQTPENHITIQRYLDGKVQGVPFDKTIPVVVYRLPTEEEWEILAAGDLDAQQYPLGRDENKIPKKREMKDYINVKQPPADMGFAGALNDNAYITAPVLAYLPNKLGLYNMVGNVAEMTATKGIAKGGSFAHKADECAITTQQTYDKPSPWLGMRFVASYLEF